MKRSRLKPLAAPAVLAIVVTCLAGCTESPAPTVGPIDVFVTIPPQADFVERIAGRHVNVNILVPAGSDPHLYAPTPRQIMALGSAKIYFAIGLPVERALLAKVSATCKELTIVDTTAGITPLASHNDRDHHNGADPHVWLAPPEIRVQAQNIAAALKETDPAHTRAYEENLAGFLNELDALNRKLAETLEPHRKDKLYVFHPAFGYFARAYGFEQVALSPQGKTPSPRELETFIHHARANNVKTIFVQSQFDPSSAQKAAHAIGARIETINPLQQDVLANLSDIARSIAGGSRPES